MKLSKEWFPGECVPFNGDRLKGNMKRILPLVEKSRKKLFVDQDKIQSREELLFPSMGYDSLLPFCKRSRTGFTGRFTSGNSMEGAGTIALGSMEAVNEADDRE